jgi:hypothetical protein
MLNIEERVVIFSAQLRGLNYQQVQHSFERKLRKPAPPRANVRLLVNKFKRTGRPQTSEDDAGRIQQATEQSPRTSIRHLINQLGRAVAQRLDAGFPPRRPGFACGQHVGFVVDKAALGQVFSEYFGFPCQSFHRFLHYHNHPRLTQ